MSEFRYPGTQLGGVVKQVADLHKKPGKGAVEVFVYVDSIEETINVGSFIFSFIRPINLIRVLIHPMNLTADNITPLTRKSRKQAENHWERKCTKVQRGLPRAMRIPKATLGVSGRQEKLPTLELNALERPERGWTHPREIPR